MKHAIVRDGRVENVAEWDGETEWSPPAGTQLVPAGDASPGDTWDGTRFIKPLVEPPKKRVDRFAELEARIAKLEARAA